MPPFRDNPADDDSIGTAASSEGSVPLLLDPTQRPRGWSIDSGESEASMNHAVAVSVSQPTINLVHVPTTGHVNANHLADLFSRFLFPTSVNDACIGRPERATLGRYASHSAR